jgi:hypothetical protein
VYRGIQGNQPVAVKCVRRFLTPTKDEEANLVLAMNRVRILSHPNIIRIKGTCVMEGGSIGVIMEYCSGGSLLDVFAKLYQQWPNASTRGGRLPWVKARMALTTISHRCTCFQGLHVIRFRLLSADVPRLLRNF